jgi:hypothetical protein
MFQGNRTALTYGRQTATGHPAVICPALSLPKCAGTPGHNPQTVTNCLETLRCDHVNVRRCACAGVLAPQATTHRMHWRERYQRTLALWPYMVPLALVYFAEYAMQVGAQVPMSK